MMTLLKSFQDSVKYWYLPLIVGILFVAIGVYVFFVPVETYVTLSILFIISFIISGLFDTFFAIRNSKILSGWGWYLVNGLISLALGIYLIIYPAVSVEILPFVVGFMLMFRSFQFLGFAFEMKEIKMLKWGNVAITSILGIVFSFLLLTSPFFTAISLVSFTAITFIFVGVSSIILSFNLKKLKNYPGKVSEELKTKINDLQKEIDAII